MCLINNGKQKRRDGCLQHTATPNRNASYGDSIMANKPLPPPEVIRQLLRYEPDTGRLFWLPRPVEMLTAKHADPTWNAKHAGRPAFVTKHNAGYFVGTVMKRQILAHRVIWCLVAGCWPECEIDHIDGDRANNKWDNLRLATRSQNMRNSKSHTNSSSRFRGVSWNTRRGHWVVYITIEGRSRHVGSYSDETLAARAFDRVAQIHHGAFARLNFPAMAGELA